MGDIFDTTDVSDLPDEMRNEVERYNCREHGCVNIAAAAGRPVTAREVQVAKFRLTGKRVKLKSVTELLSRAANAGRLKHVGRDQYSAAE